MHIAGALSAEAAKPRAEGQEINDDLLVQDGLAKTGKRPERLERFTGHVQKVCDLLSIACLEVLGVLVEER